MPRKKRNKPKGTPLLILAIILLLAGATAILAPVLTVEMELRHDTEEYEQLKEQYRNVTNDDPPHAKTTEAAHPAEMPEPRFAPPIPIQTGKTGVDLAACKAENEDFIAWLQIPGTTVDYPVVLSNDTDYYLEHTFAGKKSYLGTLFSLEKTDYRTPGRNIAIFGHHIRSNSQVMFSPLLSYKKQSFNAEHKTIHLDSLYHSDTYIVFAVINMRSGDWDPSATSFASDDDFLSFVHRARSQSLYETGVEVTAEDQILTLITCDRGYMPKYGRLVVMAVRQEPTNHKRGEKDYE